MTDPGIAFHRYFQTPILQAKLHYFRRQPLEELAQQSEEVLARDMKDIQDHLNRGFSETSRRVLANGKTPNIYCDYAKPGHNSRKLINAHAFHDGEWYFLALTTPLVIRMSECAGYLGESPHIRSLFNIPFGDDKIKDKLRADVLHRLFFGHQLNLLFGHELGHHFLGHTFEDGNSFEHEFAIDTSAMTMGGKLTEQANEVQADSYSAEYLLTSLFESPIREYSLAYLGREPADKEGRELLIGIYVVAITSVLFALPDDPDFSEARPFEKPHPLKPARLNNLIARMQSYLGRVAPDLIDWLDLDKLNTFVQRVTSSLPPISSACGNQTSFLLSKRGANYYKILLEEVTRLDKISDPHRWVPVAKNDAL